MRYRITAPERTHNGVVAGITFHQGQAEVDDTATAALAYFRRRGYGVDPVDRTEPTAETPTPVADGDDAGAPKRPAVNDNKAAWVAYVVTTGLMAQDDAEKSTKDDLIKAAMTSEENGQ